MIQFIGLAALSLLLSPVLVAGPHAKTKRFHYTHPNSESSSSSSSDHGRVDNPADRNASQKFHFAKPHSSSSSSSSSSSDVNYPPAPGGCTTEVTVICQNDIPLNINRPGVFVLGEDLTLETGSGPAITISANDVKLHLGSFSITVCNLCNSTAILVECVTEFLIDSDGLFHNNTTGYGIHVVNSDKGLINNVYTDGFFNGLFIEDSSNISVTNSEFTNSGDASIQVVDSFNIVFDNVVGSEGGPGLAVGGFSNQSLQILNSNFFNTVGPNLVVQQVEGLVVDNCTFNTVFEGASVVQLGDTDDFDHQANDVTFKNSSVINRDLGDGVNTSAEGIAAYNVNGLLVDSVLVDIDNSETDPGTDLSGIHLGDGSGDFVGTNVIIRNSIFQGPAMDGIYPDLGSSNVLIENNLVSQAQKDGMFLAGTSNSTVQNNTVVNNGTNGIFLGENSTNNAVLNNVVSGNGFGTLVGFMPQGAGIAIDNGAIDSPTFPPSNGNTIQHNEVFNNRNWGVNDLNPFVPSAPLNTIWFNTASNNGTPVNVANNYKVASGNTTLVTTSPGSTTFKAAANISA